MVALAPAGVLASPASLLARYAGPFGAARPARRAEATPAAETPAVLAQISQAAQALFAKMREQGVAATSFDLHLDLDRVGVSVDGRGNRSVEGHSLSVDLHVEAQQGVMQTDRGEVQFERLQVEFEMTETRVVAHESADAAPGSSLEDSLASLGKLLSDATKGSDKSSFDFDDMLQALDEQVGRMRDLLARIGQALQERAGRPDGAGDRPGCAPAPRSTGAAGRAESFQMSLEVSLKSLLFTRAAAAEPAAAPAAPALEGASAA
jgi:hypothetical protein